MNLEALAFVGQFVGGLAVLVTIGYLAHQSRQTRRLLEQSTGQQTASMLRANIDGWNHMFATILTNQDMVDTYARMRRGDSFNEEERERPELLATMFFLNLENFILQNQMTPFVEGVNEIIQGIVEFHVRVILKSPTLCDWWDREKVIFSTEFGEAVEGARVSNAQNGP